ncbi:MAG TPA: hypothetical protein VGE74_27960 [Gemmata sp.]
MAFAVLIGFALLAGTGAYAVQTLRPQAGRSDSQQAASGDTATGREHSGPIPGSLPPPSISPDARGAVASTFPAGPPVATPPPVAAPTREDQLKLLAKELKAPTVEAKIKALKLIEAYGVEANAVGESLIEAMADSTPAVRDRASEVLEKVNPRVHPHVFTILRGMNKVAAIRSLGELRGEAVIAIPLLLSSCEVHGPGFVFPVVAKIAPKDKRFANAVFAVIGNPKSDRRVGPVGGIMHNGSDLYAGLIQLEVIEATPAEKVESLVKSLQKAVDRVDEGYWVEDDIHQLIIHLQKYRADAKTALPILKKLKLSPRDPLRNAATKAIREIE